MSSPDFDHLDDELTNDSSATPDEPSDDFNFVLEDADSESETTELQTTDTWESLTRDALMSPSTEDESDALDPPILSQVANTTSIATPDPPVDSDTSDLQKELIALEEAEAASQKQIVELTTEVEKLQAEVKSANMNAEATQRELEQANATINRLSSELEQIAKERLIADRTKTLVELGLESNLSFESATKFASLGQDDFDSIIRLVRNSQTTV